MGKARTPFLMVNPKSYLWGRESLELAKACDRLCKETGIMVLYTCPYADIRLIAENTEYITVTAQNMDHLRPGRGMGAVLPESLKEAGAKAVVLNHAENQKNLSTLSSCIARADELGMITIACADSTAEAKAAAELGCDIILAEPTVLIGTGNAADPEYIKDCCEAIRSVDPEIGIMIGSGITTGDDVYTAVLNGADGAGSTSGIVNAPSREDRVREMLDAIRRALADRER